MKSIQQQMEIQPVDQAWEEVKRKFLAWRSVAVSWNLDQIIFIREIIEENEIM